VSDRPSIKGAIASNQQFSRVVDGACSEAIENWFALFHQWNFITAEASEGKPKWITINKFPLNPKTLYQRWKSSSELVGVRFKPGKEGTTSYALIDVDIGSQYHPQQAPSAIQALIAALEEIGVCRHIKVRSSASCGLHLYLPLPKRFNCYKLAVVLQQALEKHEFQIKPGQLEIFPNVKMPRSNYAAHRLPLQIGSFVLDDDFQPLHNSIERLIQVWSTLAEKQDLACLTKAIGSAKWNRPSHSRNLEEWRERLETSLSKGFTSKGQTNKLLQEVCIYLRVFRGLSWDEVEAEAYAVIAGLSGYQEYCRHQREIKRRIRDWVKTNRNSSRYYPANSPSRLKKSAKAPSNKDRSEDALNRIQQAIAHLAESGTCPNGIRERQNRIRELARCGTKTLWKYKELWHPDFQTQRCVTQGIATVSEISETPNGNTLLSSDGEQNLSSKQSECVTQDISMVSEILEEASATRAIAEIQLEQAVTHPALLSVISSYGSESNPLGNTNTVRLNPNQDLSSNPTILTRSIVKRKSDNSLFRITKLNANGTYWAKWLNPPVPRAAVILREDEIDLVNYTHAV
jgi:hypothetical protein